MLNLALFNKKMTDEEKLFQKEKYDFTERFYALMFELGIYNKFNRTFYFDIYYKTEYGFLARVYLEPGLSFEKLSENLTTIQENLNCLWIMTTQQFKNFAQIRIITKPLDENIVYTAPNIKPWEMYLGLDFAGNPIINDNNEYQMFLMGGGVGTGKSRFMSMILLSYILCCDLNDVEIYLSDIAKNEYINFKWCRMVRSYASELEDLHKMMKYIRLRINKRNATLSRLREDGRATNIKEYNEISKSKMSYIYVFIDEFSVIVPDNTDSPQEKAMKQEILDTLKKLSKIGRSLGVFTFIALQKTTKEELGSSILKNMAAVRISFRANDRISSEVIMGDHSAVGLAPRYAVYSQNGGGTKDYLFSPKITTERLNELLKPHIDRNYRKVDLDAALRFAEEPEVITKKSAPISKEEVKNIKARIKIQSDKVPTFKPVFKLKEGDFIDS